MVREKNHKTAPVCVEILLRLRIKQVEDRQGKDDRDKDRKKVDRDSGTMSEMSVSSPGNISVASAQRAYKFS